MTYRSPYELGYRYSYGLSTKTQRIGYDSRDIDHKPHSMHKQFMSFAKLVCSECPVDTAVAVYRYGVRMGEFQRTDIDNVVWIKHD